ncbi:hypothetical protein [Lewinella cohaerens]|uniref:hypothetical protein n=1 Tax=Lewinella cohaerens TaxID=70995 RepID=UPI000362F48B|nr:hypothetical protein [Lewinella cohaerens]
MKNKADAEREARIVVNKWTAVATAVGWVPFSQFFLAPADYRMVANVAKCFEVKKFDAEAVLTAAGATVTGKTIFHTLLDFFPPAWFLKSGTAAAVTKAVGEIVILHFKSRTTLPD